MTVLPPPTVGLDAFPFHVHWDVLGLAAAIVAGYVYGIRVLAARHAPTGTPAVTRRQIAWFASGLVAFLIVEVWPFHDIAEGSLFSFHMTEHMVLAFVVPPALLKGMPSWLLRLVVRPVLPVLRVLTKPLVAIVVFNAALALIHVPSVLTEMVTNGLFHFGSHLVLMIAAGLMWWPVIGPIPDLPRLEPVYAMGYLFLQSLVPTIPASFLTFADGVVYKVYDTLPRLWGLDVKTDQLISGLIMKIGGGAILWTAITVIFFKWAAEEELAGRAHTGASRLLSRGH